MQRYVKEKERGNRSRCKRRLKMQERYKKGKIQESRCRTDAGKMQESRCRLTIDRTLVMLAACSCDGSPSHRARRPVTSLDDGASSVTQGVTERAAALTLFQFFRYRAHPDDPLAYEPNDITPKSTPMYYHHSNNTHYTGGRYA